MVPGEGVEPSLPRGNWILNPARLPIPPSGQRESFKKWEKSDRLATLEFFHARIIGRGKKGVQSETPSSSSDSSSASFHKCSSA